MIHDLKMHVVRYGPGVYFPNLYTFAEAYRGGWQHPGRDTVKTGGIVPDDGPDNYVYDVDEPGGPRRLDIDADRYIVLDGSGSWTAYDGDDVIGSGTSGDGFYPICKVLGL